VRSSVETLSSQLTPWLKLRYIALPYVWLWKKLSRKDIMWVLCQAYCETVLDPGNVIAALRAVFYTSLSQHPSQYPRLTPRHVKTLSSTFNLDFCFPHSFVGSFWSICNWTCDGVRGTTMPPYAVRTYANQQGSRLWCTNVTKTVSWLQEGLRFVDRTCWISILPTHYVGDSHHRERRWKEGGGDIPYICTRNAINGQCL
jgi:hypothetical protein